MMIDYFVIWQYSWYDMIRYYDIMMLWYDMIWYDMIWYDMIWYDMIWYDMIWYDLIDMIWYDLIIAYFEDTININIPWGVAAKAFKSWIQVTPWRQGELSGTRLPWQQPSAQEVLPIQFDLHGRWWSWGSGSDWSGSQGLLWNFPWQLETIFWELCLSLGHIFQWPFLFWEALLEYFGMRFFTGCAVKAKVQRFSSPNVQLQFRSF